MTLNVGNYQFLAPAPSAQIAVLGSTRTVATRLETLKDIRQDAKALKQSWNQAPVAPAFSLPNLSSILDRFLAWLQPSTPTTPTPPPASPGRATQSVISSFNVLGSSHTRPGGNKPGMDPGPVRIRRAVELLRAHKVDIVGFQEFQPDQVKEFNKVAGREFAVYPGMQLGRGPNVNSIAWRKDTWDLVKAETIPIPYFHGKPVKMPYVRLRNKHTGQEVYVANFHNPASTKRVGNQEKWRDIATDKQIALVNRLKRETGLPVIVTGDMNERDEYYHRMTQGAPMVTADPGVKNKKKKMAIDWIFGTKDDVSFSHYVRDRSAYVQKTTDHPMIVSRARIEP